MDERQSAQGNSTPVANAPVVIKGAVPKSGGRKNRCVAGKVELPSGKQATKRYGVFVAVTPCSKGGDATSLSITM
jgi:hypothetical protein